MSWDDFSGTWKAPSDVRSLINRTEHAKLERFLKDESAGKEFELYEFELKVEDPRPFAAIAA